MAWHCSKVVLRQRLSLSLVVCTQACKRTEYCQKSTPHQAFTVPRRQRRIFCIFLAYDSSSRRETRSAQPPFANRMAVIS